MDKRLKLIAYSAIVLFSLIFTGLIAYFVIYPLDIKARHEQRVREKDAEKFKQKADSIAHIFETTQDSINKEIKEDSIAFIHEKESIKSVYIKKVKKYESQLANIDTLSDIQLNGSFSIREMLSDSSVKVW